VFRLITCSPIEERILSRASDKLNNIGLVVEVNKQYLYVGCFSTVLSYTTNYALCQV
jgi:hypothetical protein